MVKVLDRFIKNQQFLRGYKREWNFIGSDRGLEDSTLAGKEKSGATRLP